MIKYYQYADTFDVKIIFFWRIYVEIVLNIILNILIK